MGKLVAFIFLITIAIISAHELYAEECITPNGIRGSCIPLDNCPSLKSMLEKQPLQDQDYQFLTRSQCGSVNRTVLVCCSTNAQLTEISQRVSIFPPTAVKEQNVPPRECTTPNHARGSCIPLLNCTSLVSLLRKKPLLDDDRLFIRNSRCDSEDGSLLVCCSGGHVAAQLPREQPTTPGTWLKNQVEYVSPHGQCTTPNNENGNCVPLNQCAFLYNLLQKKPLLQEDIDYLKSSRCEGDKEKILVCCSAELEKLTNERGILPEPGECGISFSNRIVGGVVTSFDEFPWTALIQYDKGNAIDHHCGGSLINKRYVVTAAHCIERIKDSWTPVSVRLGEWDTRTNPDCVTDRRGNEDCADPYVDVPIESITTHPDYVYNSKSQLNDIALIRLRNSINYTDFIKPICLPVGDVLRDISLDDVGMDIAGWGRTENGTRSTKKLKAVVHGVPLRSCRRLFGRKGFNIQDTQICAGGSRGVDSCKGDSGGGLMAMDSSNRSLMYYYLAGIISYGQINCGLSGWPGVYTRVSSYVDWIKDNIQP